MLYKYLKVAALTNPQKVALITHKKTMSYSEFWEQCVKMAERLQTFGIKKGMHIALICRNTPEVLTVFFACNYLEITIIPVNNEMPPEKLDELLHACDVSCLIHDQNLVFDIDCGQIQIIEEKIFSIQKPTQTKEIDSDISLMMNTSGTTGDVKAVMLTNQNIISNLESISYCLKLKDGDTTTILKSLSHISTVTGEVMLSIYYKCTIVLGDGIKELHTGLFRNNKELTVLFLVPTMLSYIYYNPKVKPLLKSIKKIFISGEPIAPELLLNIMKEFPNIDFIIGYGLTEASPRISMITTNNIHKKLGSVGSPIKEVSVFIKDDKGITLDPGEIGEIFVKGSNIMVGYYKDNIKTHKRLKDGGLYTGDMGYLDEDGFLFVVGRKDNMIIKDGLNLYPEEVEKVVMSFGDIENVLVRKEPINEYASEIVAYIVVAKKTLIGKEKDIIEHCSKKLDRYKVPTKIRYVKRLEKTPSGKLKRNGEIIIADKDVLE